MREKMSAAEEPTTCLDKVEENPDKLECKNPEAKEKERIVLKFDDNWLPILRRSFSHSYYKNCLDLCFKEREIEGHGKSFHMKKMYAFWMEFLQDSFNQKLYVDFRKAAVDDANNGSRYGIQCLFKFFSYGLEKHFYPELYEDFQLYAKYDYESGHMYGIEKFYAFLYYREVNTILEIDNDLVEYLSRFKSLEDFPLSDSTNKDRLRTLLPDRKRMLVLYREVKQTPNQTQTKVIVVRNVDVIASLKSQKQQKHINNKRSHVSLQLFCPPVENGDKVVYERSRSLNRENGRSTRSQSKSQERNGVVFKPRSRSAHRQSSLVSFGHETNGRAVKSQSFRNSNGILKNRNYDCEDEEPVVNWGRRGDGVVVHRDHFHERPQPFWTQGSTRSTASHPDLVHYSRSQHDVANSPLPYVVHMGQQSETSFPQPLCPDSSKHPQYTFDEILGRDETIPRPELYPYPVLAHPYITKAPQRRNSSETLLRRAGGDRYVNAPQPFIMDEPILVYLILCPEPHRHNTWDGGDGMSHTCDPTWTSGPPQTPIYHIFPFHNPRRARGNDLVVAKQPNKYQSRVKVRHFVASQF
ncbi:la-related protein 1 [Nilaparvata lugens]|uniref:la-related protein 1 n=1 Tax=Nilaparvata lugens TaxID=108931 RepID=UPI00193D43A7|nr:la-related protein 1 [Nilaparvata lugens]XP_022185218.2 la-related protein 1 [Nilaparvata lugens]XP_039281758.1 la-related protein 1 [Nilaparvata lugens]XP_039281759.1 la-related protein 1 [Nilaparvata lugens]XP_039281760.1 la-related protein 1 [Nilaparvata lugens]XP_039281761.1 la-related protein 1 [Nilaparvata lugens]